MSNSENQQLVIDIFDFFYPNTRITEIQLNDELRNLAATMHWEAIQASNLINLVPRPPSGIASFAWLIQQIVKATYRGVFQNGQIYIAVKNVIAARFRSDFEMAKMGMAV